jgi:glutamyl-tRNA synthetase/glutamyl-Q tRNA(Asp) synthetase
MTTNQNTPFITRFAPSPTGYLHRGHILNALYTWGLAKKFGGKVILRIEDHDQGRARPEYTDAILEDLEWLGFKWDSFSQQSKHWERYAEAAQNSNLSFYPCSCTRKNIQAYQEENTKELCYRGDCRSKISTSPILYPDSSIGIAKSHSWRLDISAYSAKEFSFKDYFLGSQTQRPEQQCGDWVIKDRHGLWTYNWAVAVDDWVEQVNWIIRGEDLLHATARQELLKQKFGQQKECQYAHHPLLMDHNGQKLSKRQHSFSVREERARGVEASEILAEVGALVHF